MTIVLLEALTFGLGRLVDAADRAGERLCLLTHDRGWYRYELSRLRPDALDVVDVDTYDAAACATALSKIPDLHGMINSTDTWGVTGAGLLAEFGLPGTPVDTWRLLRDKQRVRALLHQRGLSRTTAVDVPGGSDRERIVDALREQVGLPLVVKDSAGTSSRNVWIARTRADLSAALAAAGTRQLTGRLVVEPFFAGPLYSAETLTWAGRTRLLGVLSRQVSREPLVREEASAYPVALPEPDLAALAEWVASVLAAVGYEQGFAHVEFVLTSDGPELIEINGRIGGALVGEALCRRLDANVYEGLVRMALGQPPALPEHAPDSAPAVAFAPVYADRAGALTDVRGLDALTDFPGTPRWYPTARSGQRIEHLTDQRACIGFVLAEGPTAELALHRVLSAAGAVRPMISDGP
ncbi:ATP-grasp domain-containing protein [Micromonospora inyonensis]|uniref:Biotin carboxylase n=1 Tax=Micromonospora inyonensis TaxID=47866 RepID=A0A1C6RE84_9ACTN|nr:ATP-grasp domain-containing protein [Micromonospora inyonensis]SCL15465.1 Biotin carboxylase [Micromonospora inyonensis]